MEGNADIRNDSEWNGTSDEEDFIAWNAGNSALCRQLQQEFWQQCTL